MTLTGGISEVGDAESPVSNTIVSGQKDVTAAGTAERLLTAGTFTKRVHIKAKSGNTGDVYIGQDGADDVTSSNGLILSQGEGITLNVNDAVAKIWIDAGTNGDGVSYLYEA
jgi:hypothetical protein